MADVIHLINGTINNDGSSVGHVTMLGNTHILRPVSPPQASQIAVITAQSGILDNRFDDIAYYNEAPA